MCRRINLQCLHLFTEECIDHFTNILDLVSKLIKQIARGAVIFRYFEVFTTFKLYCIALVRRRFDRSRKKYTRCYFSSSHRGAVRLHSRTNICAHHPLLGPRLRSSPSFCFYALTNDQYNTTSIPASRPAHSIVVGVCACDLKSAYLSHI